MVREDAKRALLFELDTNIQKLRAAHGESEATVGLTGHYHNLLQDVGGDVMRTRRRQ